jgi:hypothetical protein
LISSEEHRPETETEENPGADRGQQDDQCLHQTVEHQESGRGAHGAHDGQLPAALHGPDREERTDHQRGNGVKESLDHGHRHRSRLTRKG